MKLPSPVGTLRLIDLIIIDDENQRRQITASEFERLRRPSRNDYCKSRVSNSQRKYNKEIYLDTRIDQQTTLTFPAAHVPESRIHEILEILL